MLSTPAQLLKHDSIHLVATFQQRSLSSNRILGNCKRVYRACVVEPPSQLSILTPIGSWDYSHQPAGAAAAGINHLSLRSSEAMTGRRVQGLSPGTAASMLRTPAGQSRGACSPTAPRPRAPDRGRATSGSGRCGVAKKSLPLRRLRTSFPVSQTVPSQGSLRRLAKRGGERDASMCSLRIQCMFVTGSVPRSGPTIPIVCQAFKKQHNS